MSGFYIPRERLVHDDLSAAVLAVGVAREAEIARATAIEAAAGDLYAVADRLAALGDVPGVSRIRCEADDLMAAADRERSST
jgi:hypothetical protein